MCVSKMRPLLELPQFQQTTLAAQTHFAERLALKN